MEQTEVRAGGSEADPSEDPRPTSAGELGLQMYTVDALDPIASVRKDPINLLFAGALGTITTLLPKITDRLGCRHDKILGNQWFCEPVEGGPCHVQDLNRATKVIAVGFRYHTRLYQINRPGPIFGGALTAAPIHHEELGWYRNWPGRVMKGKRPIDDIPDGFDNARDWVAEELSADGLYVHEIWLGNVEPIRQADGTPVASDGLALVISDLQLDLRPGIVSWSPPADASANLESDTETLRW
jgi:hypothetical protein